ncbi:Wzz/FepE/Etk N-terminal domain-containing protein [Nocardia brasiliensis]|uniref:Wzz/FepE/Etk N-terminal domain-containing protein n=1 Tax=Nocardia brasiliensis TaxID=37326 RepID=UPI0004A7861C|nr:Wzz/FepE/Etk N-terminal domain-containing protein [Nocardia brasiliensis]
MGLIDYWHIVRRRWVIIVAAVMVCLAAAGAYASTLPTTYLAASSMYVSMATGTSVNDSYQGGLAAQQRVRSYLDLATSATVAKRVIDDLGLQMSVGEVQSKIKAFSPPATTNLVITVESGTAAGARDLANSVVAQFRRLVDELETIERDAAPAARVAVVDRAELPTAPSGPQTKRLLILGVLAGLALGCAGAFVRDRTDRTLRTSNDLEALLPVPILGIIDAGRPGAPDETRRLRTRLLRENDSGSVQFTSLSSRSEPEVAAALAKSLADTGAGVLLIDADTSGDGSSGTVPEAKLGLAEVLRDGTPVSDALTALPDTEVTVLPLGAADAQTPDLLASDRFVSVVAKLRTEYDHLIVQTAPVTRAADAIAVAPLCGRTIAVVPLGSTTAPQLRGALATFGDNKLTGAVAYSKPGNRLQRLGDRLRL